jgi:DNA integrity scanning protein DisA with diadenylate cyclase activity
MKINLKYISAFFCLLLIETAIALYVHDTIIRPYVGDILVMILMYTFIKGIIPRRIRFLPVYLFIFACAVEVAQYFKLASILHLQNNRVVSTIVGSSFDIKDILCYLIGTAILIYLNRIK